MTPGTRLDEVARGPWPTEQPPDDWFDDMALLQETQVLSVLHDAARGTAGVLLECRQALQIREGNVAVLVLAGTTSLTWTEDERRAAVMAWNVVGGERRRDGDRLRLRLGLVPTASLQATAARAALHVLEVPGLDDAPVDYTAGDDDAVRAGTPGWHMTGTPVVSYLL